MQPINTEQEHSAIPHARLYLIAHGRSIILGAKLVCRLQEFLRKPYSAVIHKNYLMHKARSLINSGVVFLDLFFKVGDIIDHHRNYLIESVLLGCIAEFRPQTAECLKKYRRTVIVTLNAAVFVAHHKEHGSFSVILGLRKCSVQLVEACKHHFERRFT